MLLKGKSEKLFQEKNKSKLHSHKFGLFAEIIVCVYLTIKGYKIKKRRYKTPLGEIDIIAVKKNYIVFFEVKARADKNTNEVVSKNQMKRISDAARHYITKNQCSEKYNYRIDLIIFRSALAIKHIENSWEFYS